MYVFGGWVPVVESENKPNALGVEWICTNSLSLLNLGKYCEFWYWVLSRHRLTALTTLFCLGI